MPKVKQTNSHPRILVKKLHGDAKIPVQRLLGDAGYDLSSMENCTLKAGESVTVSTGLAFVIPRGYCGIIKSRSSLARDGLDVKGGVIDSGYRGDVKVILHNRTSDNEIAFEKGDRIAQMVVIPVLSGPLVEVDELDDTERGAGGFGSTGKGQNTVPVEGTSKSSRPKRGVPATKDQKTKKTKNVKGSGRKRN